MAWLLVLAVPRVLLLAVLLAIGLLQRQALFQNWGFAITEAASGLQRLRVQAGACGIAKVLPCSAGGVLLPQADYFAAQGILVWPVCHVLCVTSALSSAVRHHVFH